MKIQIVSDIHLEVRKKFNILNKISDEAKNVDVLVVAGDLGEKMWLRDAFKILCNNYKHVVYVPGNHEYYGSTKEELEEELTECVNQNSNLHWLNSSFVEIEGQRFIGSTLWFPDTKEARKEQKGYVESFGVKSYYIWSDFCDIKNFDKWIWDEFKKQSKFLLDNIKDNDIVVSHYLPFIESVSPKWLDSKVNCFFLSDLSKIMKKTDQIPKLFIHGHTHDKKDYILEADHWFDQYQPDRTKKGIKIRVVCNPIGYIRENNQFENKIIET